MIEGIKNQKSKWKNMGKFNFKNEKDFSEIKEKAEKFYKTTGKRILHGGNVEYD